MSIKSFILANGKVVCDKHVCAKDLWIEGERIRAVLEPAESEKLQQQGVFTVDVKGMYLLPGGIDAHTHFALPVGKEESADDFYSGSVAALIGGTTTVIDFANQVRGETLKETLKKWQQKAKGKAACDYSFHVSITDVNERTLSEMRDLVVEEGITSFKTFMAYKNMRLTEQDLRILLKRARELKAIITVHAEKGEKIERDIAERLQKGETSPAFHPLTRPVEYEDEAVESFIHLVEEEKSAGYIVHMTSAWSAKMVEAARERGVHIFAETCPQYLLLSKERYDHIDFDEAAKVVMSPPLRDHIQSAGLWESLARADDLGISVVATDHCSFSRKQKRWGKDSFASIPNGAPGVEERLSLLFSEGVLKNRLTFSQFVKCTATEPARIFGLYPRKGVLAAGSDADVIVWDPKANFTITDEKMKSLSAYSCFAGMNVHGRAQSVYLRGSLVVEDGQFLGVKGQGHFLQRNSSWNNF